MLGAAAGFPVVFGVVAGTGSAAGAGKGAVGAA